MSEKNSLLTELFPEQNPPTLDQSVQTGAFSGDVIQKILNQHKNTSALLKGVALLWHGDLEGSHKIAQAAGSREGDFLHAIMHRKEGDPSNSKYWWRQTGDHPLFKTLWDKSLPVLKKHTGEFPFTSKNWDPNEFVDYVAKQSGPHGEKWDYDLAIELQKLEMLELARMVNG